MLLFYSILFSYELKADTIYITTFTERIVAAGNAEIRFSSSILKSNYIEFNKGYFETLEAGFNLMTSTVSASKIYGSTYNFTLENLHLVDSGLRVKAMKAIVRENQVFLRNFYATTCENENPHYRLKGSAGKLIAGKKINGSMLSLYIDWLPVFFLPYYSRSLEDKFYHISFEPSITSDDGFILKSILILNYKNSSLKYFNDMRQNSGTGNGVEYTIRKNENKMSIYGYEINDKRTGTRQIKLKTQGFLEVVKSRVYTNINADQDSSVDTSERFFRESWERAKIENTASASVTYLKDNLQLRGSFFRTERLENDVFNIKELKAPKIEFTLFPARINKTFTYSSNGSFENHYELNEKKFVYNFSFTPLLTAEIKNLRARNTTAVDFTYNYDPSVKRNTFINYINNNFNLKIPGRIEVDAIHSVKTISKKDSFSFDADRDDYGIPENKAGFVLTGYLNKSTLRFKEFYDLRNIRNMAVYRLLPLEFEFYRGGLYYQFAYSFSNNRPQRNFAYIKHGYSGISILYDISNDEMLSISPEVSINLAGWNVNTSLRWFGNYKNFRRNNEELIEKNIKMSKNIHCFYVQVTYLNRYNVESIFFNIMLSLDFERLKDQKQKLFENEFYPWR